MNLISISDKAKAALSIEEERLLTAIADHVTVRSELRAALERKEAALKVARDALVKNLESLAGGVTFNLTTQALAAIDAAMKGEK